MPPAAAAPQTWERFCEGAASSGYMTLGGNVVMTERPSHEAAHAGDAGVGVDELIGTRHDLPLRAGLV